MPQITVHPDHLDVHLQIGRTASTDVNVFQVAQQLLARFKALLAAVIAAELAARLKRELGPSGQSGNRFEGTGGLACPDCGSGAANRKSWRDRTVEIPRLGDVEIKRPYLRCRNCDRAYAPYDAGLPDQRRYGWEGLRRPLEATLETSYRRGEEAYPESPSRSTLWRRVQERQPALEEGRFEEGRRADVSGSDAAEGLARDFVENVRGRCHAHSCPRGRCPSQPLDRPRGTAGPGRGPWRPSGPEAQASCRTGWKRNPASRRPSGRSDPVVGNRRADGCLWGCSLSGPVPMARAPYGPISALRRQRDRRAQRGAYRFDSGSRLCGPAPTAMQRRSP